MSASLRLRFGAVAVAFSCLAVGYAAAQQETQTPGEIKPAQASDDAAGQNDRAVTQQGEQSPTQRTDSPQQRTANFRGTPPAAGGQELERHLAGCLLTKNQAEIEINEFAQQQAQNPEVKKFAQKMVQDHRQLSLKLQQIAGDQVAASRPGARTEYERERETTSTRLPGSPGASQTIPPSGTTTTTTTENVNRNENVNLSPNASPTADSGVLTQLAEIEKKVTQQCTQALREELQQKSGAEFDECYLGSQVGGHMHMLAALEVIQQETQGQLRQVAEQARPIVQQHLEHAKQLAKQAKNAGSQRVGQVERQSIRTER